MKTVLKITMYGKGVPGQVLDGVEKALHAYYDSTPMSQAWTLPGKEPARLWVVDIELIPEDEEDEVEAARIRGG